MILLYIQLINKPWYPPESIEMPYQPTFKKLKLELERADIIDLRIAKNAKAIRKIQQVYYLERRLFV